MNLVLLQAQGQPSMMPTILMLVAMFAILYFFMIRPQQKKQKEIQKFRNSLTVGQDIVTIKSVNDADNTVTIEVATGVKIKFAKAAIVPNYSDQERR